MTLSQRNRYFKAGIVLSSACLAGLLSQAARLLPLYPGLVAGAARRAPGLFQQLAARHFPAVPQTPFASASAAIACALAASILIFVFFEKTHAPEILFFGLFALSPVFETIRFMVPLRAIYGFPVLFLVFGARILFFGRFSGALALFASSIYAAGFEPQKQGTVVFAIAIATLIISLGIPVDALSWDTSLAMISVYGEIFRRAEAAILVIAALTFFVAAYTRGSADYLIIAPGALFAALGRNLLIGADTWITLVPGVVFLCAGIWVVIARLHRVYLWL
ncbi:MAG: hypothetical protein LBG84_01005 [Treponema sp.]|jgi:hypothetical protein|nr:hypothetical protein [Treponema sp.]